MAAFLNALYEEGTKQDCWGAAVKLWEENKLLRNAIKELNDRLGCARAERPGSCPHEMQSTIKQGQL